MADVFVSYTEANRVWVRGFTATLCQRGWSVWWDRHISPGAEFAPAIERELDTAQCVIVVWSHESAQSTWVRGEADRAHRRGVLLPVRIDNVDLPLPYNQLQTLNLAGWTPGELHDELDRCLAAIEAHVGRSGAPIVPVSHAHPWWRAATIATVLLLILVGVITWRDRHRWIGVTVGTAIERMLGAAESLPTAWFSAAPGPRRVQSMNAAGTARAEDVTKAAGEALRAVRGLPEEPRVSAFAYVVMKRHQTAVKELEQAVADPKADVACYSDLAAARYEAAKAAKEPSGLVAALADADRAVQRVAHPGKAPAFNRTLIVEELGLTEEAAQGWQAFVRASRDARWAQAGRRRLDALEQQTRRDWNAARPLLEEAIGRGDGPAIADLVRTYHHEARTYGEIDVLGEWGAAQADPRVAARHLQIARAIGDALRQVTGESMLADAVTAIDRAGSDAKAALAKGHAAYRRAVRSSDPDALRLASNALHGHTPMEREVEYTTAGERLRRGDVAAAFGILSQLLERERAEAPSHRALVAYVQIALARCHAAERRWDDALQAAADARRILTMIGETRPAADADVLLAAVADYLGRPDAAWTHRIPALRTMSGARDRAAVVRVLTTSARMELLAGRADAALSLLAIARRLARASDERVAIAEVEALRSRILLQKGEAAQARNALLTARRLGAWSVGAELDVVEATLIRQLDARRSVELASKAVDVYRRAASIDLPWAYHERGRSYLSLGDDRAAMRDFDSGLRAIASTSAPVQQPQVRAAVLATRSDLFDEAIRLRARLNRTGEAFRLVEEAHQRELVDQTDRMLESRRVQRTDPADASAVSRLLASDTALIAFYALPESLLVFVVDRIGVKMHSAAVSRLRLRELADTASHVIENPYDANGFPPELYDLLFAPVDLSSTKNVVIVPDRALQQVPFAALYDRKSGKYLIEKVTISMVPTTEAFLHSAARVRQLAMTAPAKVLVVTDPAVSPPYHLPALPWAAAEGARISRLYDSAVLLQRADATVDAFLANAPNADVIHFGGHVLVDPTRPENSRLVLASGRSGDATLAAGDIARMNLSGVRLVTLGACGSMSRTNDYQRNGGIAGSFLTAGAANVVTASGTVEDAMAETFFTAFHRSFARGHSTAEAVREAQLAMLRGGKARLSRPFAWAQFVAIGGSGGALRSDVLR